MITIRLVLTGRNYHAAGGIPEELDLPVDSDVSAALEKVAALLPEGQTLPASCLVTLGGKHLGSVASHDSPVLKSGDELVLIAPVAGG